MKRKRDLTRYNEEFWYPLDNAAKIYPAITTDELTSVFRITAKFKHEINIKRLFNAVRSIESRFPYFNVKIKQGFFWYYFESANLLTLVEVDNKKPCRNFDKKGLLFRVLVINKRLSVEFSHLLADGTGAMEYFKTLLIRYFELSGIETPSTFNYLKPGDEPNPEEFEDGHNRYFQEDIPASVKRPKAFHLPFALNPTPRLEVLNAIIQIADIKAKASEKGYNVTVYLIAIYLYVIQEIFESLPPLSRYRKYKKLSLEVPINLRNIYPTATMRNFSLFVMPEIDLSLGHYSFDEILKTVYHQMQLETDEKLVNKILARNVGSERKLLIRSIPLFVKSFVLKTNYYSLGCSQYSGVFTNMGVIKLPPLIEKQIEYFILTPPPPTVKLKVVCGVIGLNDKLVLSFANISKSKELEKRFINFLVEQGIPVKLTT
jgi:NRPS condensation-like uncharacterized protein